MCRYILWTAALLVSAAMPAAADPIAPHAAARYGIYLTFESLWAHPFTFFNMWVRRGGLEAGPETDFELISRDYGIKPPKRQRYDLRITHDRPLRPGTTYTTGVIRKLPTSGFTFFSLGAAGDFGFTGWSDVPSPRVFTDGSVVEALWPTGGPGPGCETCGTIPILRVMVHEKIAPASVPEPSMLALIALAGLALMVTHWRAPHESP